ncbi:hypothetical protein CPB84DRAFT_1800352, partial [Gymnopilus junonius]
VTRFGHLFGSSGVPGTRDEEAKLFDWLQIMVDGLKLINFVAVICIQHYTGRGRKFLIFFTIFGCSFFGLSPSSEPSVMRDKQGNLFSSAGFVTR